MLPAGHVTDPQEKRVCGGQVFEQLRPDEYSELDGEGKFSRHLKFLRNWLGVCPEILRKARVNELLLE
jgi:hypothetical protein